MISGSNQTEKLECKFKNHGDPPRWPIS